MPTSQALLAEAMAENRAGQRGRAEELFRALIARDAGLAQAHYGLGLVLLQSGRPAEAFEAYREAVRLRPDYPEALNDLGISLRIVGRLDEAIAAYRQALAVRPGLAEALRNLGDALCAKGQTDEAIALCRQALAARQGNAYVLLSLGNALIAKGARGEAIECLRQAVANEPKLAEALVSLSNALSLDGQNAEAAAAAERAIAVRPDYGDAHDNLSIALRRLDRFEEAEAAARRASELSPRSVDALLNLGMALQGQKRHDEAAEAYRRAIAIEPNDFRAWHNLGLALTAMRQIDAAEGAYQKALSLSPMDAKIHKHLGLLYRDQSRPEEAVAIMRRSTELDPADATCHSNLIFTMSHAAGISAGEVLMEARRWEARHAAALSVAARAFGNDRSPERRIRVGYVSADFCRHVVGRSFLPLVSNHDRERVEVACYSAAAVHDEHWRKIKERTDIWRDIRQLNDERAAELIREDGIDVLVDLGLHTGDNRLLVFARRPAPVQVSFLGYPGTTGMAAMGYRLTDPWLDPVGAHEADYSEKSIRLAKSYWCYDPTAENMPAEEPIAETPAKRAGHVTFGSLNNPVKLSRAVLELWARLLGAAAGSRLILHAHPGRHLQAMLEVFSAAGIAADRVEIIARQGWSDYIRTYHRIDLALDTFPYGGGITTCDALWMGTPVVTLAGESAVGRGGVSILQNLGMGELVAESGEEYVRIAAGLAGDLDRLWRIRGELRGRMRASALMDGKGYAADVEAAYRTMWREWCASGIA